MGCPAMHRWEVKERETGNRERLAQIKVTKSDRLDMRPPVAQPHLTLYGRDYVVKKKASTEAAFADLKMIQTIARTLSRKTEIPDRKGPVSLNSVIRKKAVYSIMEGNHKMLDGLEKVTPFCNTQDLVADFNFKR